MATIQWRPEVNALTTPQSYTVRYMAREVLGYDELAAEMARDNPLWDKEMIKAILIARDKTVMQQLINGNQVTLENAFRYRLSFNARLNSLDDPLPPVEDMLLVKVSASRSFVKEVRQEAKLERLPAEERLPLITAAEDTVLGLNDVLNPAGAVRLTGSDLFFEQEEAGGECVLEGTRSGKIVQSRFVKVSNTEISFMPDIPAQDDPWNNEYSVAVSTRYTEHGTLRTGIYRRKLRSPLAMTLGDGSGILTDKANSPYVTVTGGSLSADETLRIQVILDLHEGSLSFNLLDMKEGGKAGAAVTVTADGDLTLSGFSDSALSSLSLTVNNFAQLVKMTREGYGGRLVDVLTLHQGS